MTPPKAKIINKKLTIHGDTRIDPYYWLNQRNNPEVIKYLKEENQYTNTILKPTEKLQKQLFEEIKSRIKEDDNSVPFFVDGFWYYTRVEKGKEYSIYCRKEKTLEAPEEIILDANQLAEKFNFFNIGNIVISPDNTKLAYSIDITGRRIYTIKFIDIKTQKHLEDEIPNTSSEIIWANNNTTVFYVTKDEQTLRPNKIFCHELYNNVNLDIKVYYEKDETFHCSISKSKSKQYLIISSCTSITSEYWYVDANQPHQKLKLFQKRQRGHEYSIYHFEDKFFILSNWNAENFRLFQTNIFKTKKENWNEIIPHQENTFIEGLDIFQNYIAITERTNGLIHLRIIPNKKNHPEYYIPMPEDTYLVYTSNNYEFNTNIIRYVYSSLTTPTSTFDFDMSLKTSKLLKRQEILGGFDPTHYHSERIYSTSHDNKKIPISIVYKKNLFNKKQQPLLLYGYGSYGISVDPSFSSTRLSLLDRGFAFAIAHIRGGEEMGRKWYDNGKMFDKKNTFLDFIACAKHLIKNNYTTEKHLYAYGGSAGGLLMGAVINMQPELFNGVIAEVPFVDVLTTMLDESIPLTTGEYDEWGNPNNKDSYEYIKSYSPYDNIEKKEYPNLFILAGLHDSQVQYWEPAKWVAKLRTFKTDNNKLLLYTDMSAGHSGKSGRYKSLKEIVKKIAFLIQLEK